MRCRSGGYKISALDVERAFLSHPAVLEIAVVGVEDETWGQQVAAVAVFRDAALAPSLDEVYQRLLVMSVTNISFN